MTAHRTQRLLTFRSGGWLLLLSATVCTALVVWAVAPALMRHVSRPAGDGETIESYGFDLSKLQVPGHLVAPAMRFRDMVQPHDIPDIQTIDDPDLRRQYVLTIEEAAKLRKYILADDRVIGVAIGDEARAYPISVMNVHEIVHDTLGGVPIAVTYHWPGECVMVFDRRVGDETLDFGVSGLVYNSNMLMYERRDDSNAPEPLWCQLLAAPITGPRAGADVRLTQIPASFVSWEAWCEIHPQTTVIARSPEHKSRRYTKAEPTPYFQQRRVLYPVEPMPPDEGMHPFDRIVSVMTPSGAGRTYELALLSRLAAGEEPWIDTLGDREVEFRYHRDSNTVLVVAADDGPPLQVSHALWFAWHAMHPDDIVWRGGADR